MGSRHAPTADVAVARRQPAEALAAVCVGDGAGEGIGGVVNRVILPQAGWVLLIIGVGIALLWPVSQLYIRAAADGGAAFVRATQIPYIWETVRVTFLLALASSVIAVAPKVANASGLSASGS